MNNRIQTPPAGQSQIKFNQGQALLHLANTYPSLHEVILELVQNALDTDVNATRISITINYQKRFLAVRDNGAGTSIARFNSALASVATPGRKSATSLGRFGIGLISSLGKCERFTFTSCPEPETLKYHRWKFDTEQIIHQSGDLFIPNEACFDYAFNSTAPRRKNVDWRSEMALEGFTTDKWISRVTMDGLISAIQDRYNAVMERNKARISIRITHLDGEDEIRNDVGAMKFRGRKLEPLELLDETGNKVAINLYIAPKGKMGRNGKVLVGIIGNDFRFPFRYLSQSLTGMVNEEVITALASGFFEGEIVAQNCKLHANRSTFHKDDGLIGFGLVLEEWFAKHGKTHLEEARQVHQEERYQRLGAQSMKVVEAMLDNAPAGSSLKGVIDSFKQGNVGTNHATVDGKKALGETDQTFLAVRGTQAQSSEEEVNRKPREKGNPETHKPNHTPLTVQGPKGEHRKLVRGHSMGLAFSYEGMEGSGDLWKLDTKKGVLHFNVRHPLWTTCDDKSDVAVMKLQEQIALQALTLHSMPEPQRLVQRMVLDELMHSIVTWIIQGDRARGTVGGARKAKVDKQ